MNKLFILIALWVSLFISVNVGFCQTKTIVVGFTSDTTKKQELIFFDNNLEIIKRLTTGSFATVGDIRIFRKGEIERVFIGNLLSSAGMTVIDLKSGEVMGRILEGNIIDKIEIDDRGNLYALNGLDDLFIIDPESLLIKKFIQLDETRRRGFSVAISKKTGTIYIAEPMSINGRGVIKVMSIDENGIKTDIGETDFVDIVIAGGIPIFVREDEKKLYVVTNFKISEFDLVKKRKRDIKTDVEFAGPCYFDDKTNNLCMFKSFEGVVKIVNVKNGRKSKVIIGEPRTDAFIAGNGKGIAISNIYRASRDLVKITMFNLKNETVISKNYEMSGSQGKVLVE